MVENPSAKAYSVLLLSRMDERMCFLLSLYTKETGIGVFLRRVVIVIMRSSGDFYVHTVCTVKSEVNRAGLRPCTAGFRYTIGNASGLTAELFIAVAAGFRVIFSFVRY